MKNIRNAILFLVVIFANDILMAQSIKVDYDKKVIMTDSLNMPPNTSMLTVLAVLPELLQRPGEFIMSNYDVQIENMSVGDAADVAISQLQIVDVEKIEVCESPISSYTNNGQGGSINFFLRSSGKNGESSWGSAGAQIAYETHVAPQFNIGYKNRKFMVRGMAFGEIFNSSSEAENVYFDNGTYSQSQKSSYDDYFRTQLARAYLQFNPSATDRIKINLSEIYSYDKYIEEQDYGAISSSESKKHSTNLHAMANYQHDFKHSAFTAEMQYIYIPGKSNYYKKDVCVNNNDFHSNQIAGKLEFSSTLFNKMKVNGLSDIASITVGVDLNRVRKTEDILLNDLRYGSSIKNIQPDNKTFYVMPYARFEGTFGKFRIKLVGEFQHFEYDIRRNDLPFTKKSDDFTGKFMGEWHFTPQKNLRLILDRKLQRPGDNQLYPYSIYNQQLMGYEKGNPELNPTLSHEISVDYIANYIFANRHFLTFNVAANFNHVNNIIVSKQSDQDEIVDMGLVQKCLIYENNGHSNILGTNMMALYSYRAFSVSLTGNFFYKHQTVDGISNYSSYFNLQLHPYFNLKDGWHGGACLIYMSKEKQKSASLGSSSVAYMTVGKVMKNIFIYAYEKVAMQKRAIDHYDTSDNSYHEKRYEMIPDNVGIGMKYMF